MFYIIGGNGTELLLNNGLESESADTWYCSKQKVRKNENKQLRGHRGGQQKFC